MMDYEIGSIADLISGNHTPNRAKVTYKPLTPVKHQPSSNVTPQTKNDNKIRTPRIPFTPEHMKTIKNLKNVVQNPPESPKSAPIKRKSKPFNNFQFLSQLDDHPGSEHDEDEDDDDDDDGDRHVSKKKKKTAEEIAKGKTVVREYYESKADMIEKANRIKNQKKVERKKKDRNVEEKVSVEEETNESKQEKKKNKNKDKNVEMTDDAEIPKKKNKKSKIGVSVEDEEEDNCNVVEKKKKKSKKRTKVEVEDKSESENESDNELEVSDAEIDMKEINKELEEEYGKDEESEKSEEEVEEQELTEFQKAAKKRVERKMQRMEKFSDDELQRTIFVGNLPVTILKQNFDKMLRKRFSVHGAVDTLRIRNIPVVDYNKKPKIALIEKKFHPDRTSVNAYIKFKEINSVAKALVENNTLLEGNHIRVDRCHGQKKPSTDNRTTIFLGNLPFNVEEETIRELFSRCGTINSIRVVRDRQTQIGKGIGFVNFDKSDGVELAMTMDDEDLRIKNKVVRVQRYNAKSKKEPKNKGIKRKHLREEKAVPKRYQQFYPQNERNEENQFSKGVGKKRDQQGNKIRKNTERRENFQKKVSEYHSQTSQDDTTDKKSNTDSLDNSSTGQNNQTTENAGPKQSKSQERHLQFKGLVAQKKKKMKLQKGILKKKKISKILLQKPKVPST